MAIHPGTLLWIVQYFFVVLMVKYRFHLHVVGQLTRPSPLCPCVLLLGSCIYFKLLVPIVCLLFELTITIHPNPAQHPLPLRSVKTVAARLWARSDWCCGNYWQLCRFIDPLSTICLLKRDRPATTHSPHKFQPRIPRGTREQPGDSAKTQREIFPQILIQI